MIYFENDIIKHKLIQAAIIDIAQNGVQAANIRSICSKADIGKTTFYNRFKDKNDLLININAYLNFKIHVQLFSNWNATDTLEKCWYKVAHSTWSLCIDYRASVIAGKYIREHFHDTDNDMGTDVLSPWTTLLTQEIKKGSIIDMPISYLNTMTVGVVRNLAVDISEGNAPKIDEAKIDTLFNHILSAIKI